MAQCISCYVLMVVCFTLIICVLRTEQKAIKEDDASKAVRTKREIFVSDENNSDQEVDVNDDDEDKVLIGFLVPRRYLRKRQVVVDSLGGGYLMKMKRNVVDSLGGDYLIGKK